jgi:hypothetical protein
VDKSAFFCLMAEPVQYSNLASRGDGVEPRAYRGIGRRRKANCVPRLPRTALPLGSQQWRRPLPRAASRRRHGEGILRRAIQGEYLPWARHQPKAREHTYPAFQERMSRRVDLVLRFLLAMSHDFRAALGKNKSAKFTYYTKGQQFMLPTLACFPRITPVAGRPFDADEPFEAWPKAQQSGAKGGNLFRFGSRNSRLFGEAQLPNRIPGTLQSFAREWRLTDIRLSPYGEGS